MRRHLDLAEGGGVVRIRRERVHRLVDVDVPARLEVAAVRVAVALRAEEHDRGAPRGSAGSHPGKEARANRVTIDLRGRREARVHAREIRGAGNGLVAQTDLVGSERDEVGVEPDVLAVDDVDVPGAVVVGGGKDRRVARRDRGQAVGPGHASVPRDREVHVIAVGGSAIRGEVDDAVRIRLSGLDVAHRPREARVARGDCRVQLVGEPAVGRALDDDVPRLLLVVAQQHRVVVDEGHPLTVGAAALVGVPVAGGTAGREALATVGRGGRGEPGQRPEARVGVLVEAECVAARAEREAAVAAAAGGLLAAWRRAEQVELVAVVVRDLRVVGDVREPGRPAVVDTSGLVDLEQRLGLVTLVVGGDRRREGEAVGRGRGQVLLDRPRRRGDLELAVVVGQFRREKGARKHPVGARRQVVRHDALDIAATVARSDHVTVRVDDGQDLVAAGLRGPGDREPELGVDRVVGPRRHVDRDLVQIGHRLERRRAVARGVRAGHDRARPGVCDLTGRRRHGHGARRRNRGCRRPTHQSRDERREQPESWKPCLTHRTSPLRIPHPEDATPRISYPGPGLFEPSR